MTRLRRRIRDLDRERERAVLYRLGLARHAQETYFPVVQWTYFKVRIKYYFCCRNCASLFIVARRSQIERGDADATFDYELVPQPTGECGKCGGELAGIGRQPRCGYCGSHEVTECGKLVVCTKCQSYSPGNGKAYRDDTIKI